MWDIYNTIELLAEAACFLVLTGVLYLLRHSYSLLREYFGSETLNGVTLGAAVFWTGYFVNMINDILQHRFMKILNSVLLVLGSGVVFTYVWKMQHTIEVKIAPKKIMNGEVPFLQMPI
ncbi:hypothetical protein E3E23_00155 [Thermococcus sp. CX2]|nr:hypothetical protein [Thermococcus sp. CX2]